MVLSIDPERERISLGIKQLRRIRSLPTSRSIRRAASSPVSSVKWMRKGAIIDLGNGVERSAKASDSPATVSRTPACCEGGQEVEARFTGVDRKGRSISLSIKAKDIHEEQEAMQNYRPIHRLDQPGRSPERTDLRPGLRDEGAPAASWTLRARSKVCLVKPTDR